MTAFALTPTTGEIRRGAELSECGRYRYRLWRVWAPSDGSVCWVLLNPSTADAETDDPTVRKCMAFAKRWGKGAIEIVNLFAWRATDPKALLLAERDHDIWGGMKNEHAVRGAAVNASIVVCGWGGSGGALGRQWGREVSQTLREFGVRLQCLDVNADGTPAHPLYLPYAAELVPFRGAA